MYGTELLGETLNPPSSQGPDQNLGEKALDAKVEWAPLERNTTEWKESASTPLTRQRWIGSAQHVHAIQPDHGDMMNTTTFPVSADGPVQDT